ncbi:hypothetical protein YS40_142 [Thermus phage phiYS40]|uniref:hypothetical protein n=1 Tax=Thermus phage phiYS40 TaxID=407392 RepID=UPI0000E68A04|nr:hypothetical protein YS40_142 [Thermus phage phiYS40]ABJ91536.1 hypothetical protein YS40_142 [Thermus phage phiYS40]BAK53660.1 hypothetical protein YSP_142 [Thermus phage phiYS40]
MPEDRDENTKEILGELRNLIKSKGSIEELLGSETGTFSQILSATLKAASRNTQQLIETLQQLEYSVSSVRRSRGISLPYARDLNELQNFLSSLKQQIENLNLLSQATGRNFVEELSQQLPKALNIASVNLGEFRKAVEKFVADLKLQDIRTQEKSIQDIALGAFYKRAIEKFPITGYYLEASGDLDRDFLSNYFDLRQTGAQRAFSEFRSLFELAKSTRNQLSISERIFKSEREIFLSRTLSEFYNESLNAISIARSNFIAQLNRVNESLQKAQSPEEVARLQEERFNYLKSLTQLYAEELKIRNEANKELRELLNSFKNFSIRELDYIFSTTRNPFVDIFASSLRQGFLIGTNVFSAVDNLLARNFPSLSRTPITTPPPTNRTPTPVPTNRPTTDRTPTNFSRGLRVGATGALFGIGLDAILNTLESGNLGEGLRRTFNIENVLKTGASFAVGSLVGLFNPILGVAAGVGTGFLLDKIFPPKEKEEVKQYISETTKNLNQFSIATSAAAVSVGSLGLAASLSANNLVGRNILTSAASVGAGVLAGSAAFLTDFYLQSVNKAYDTFYSRFTQIRLLPQQIREQLGGDVANVSRQFIFGGRVFPANQGFTTEEYLGTSARLFASIGGLSRSVDNFSSALLNSARVANLFGTSIAEAVNLVATSRRALIDERRAIRGAFLLGSEYSAFTKAFSEALISASTSIAIRQGLNPYDYFNTFLTAQTVLRNFSNYQIARLAERNPEIVQQGVSTFNEFIRSGLSGNPIALGIGIRAGLTPLDLQRGATPDNLIQVLRRLSIETGLVSQFTGGRFTAQAENFLIPIMQQVLGLTNISPEVFRTLIASAITGDITRARRIVETELGKGMPTTKTPDEVFARQLDVLNSSFQLLIDTFKENSQAVVSLNKNITTLAAITLKLSEPLGKGIINLTSEAIEGGTDFLYKYLNLSPESKKIIDEMRRNIENIPSTNTASSVSISSTTTPSLQVSSGVRGTHVIIVEGNISSVPLEEFIRNLNIIKK